MIDDPSPSPYGRPLCIVDGLLLRVAVLGLTKSFSRISHRMTFNYVSQK